MKAFIKKHESKLRFAFVGGFNTLLDFGLLFVFTNLGFNKYVANYISTSIAFVFSFFANRSFTFKSKGSLRKQIVPFLVVTLIGLWVLQPIVIWFVSQPLEQTALSSEVILLIAKLVATVASLMWNYILYSKFVFNERNHPEA